MLSAALFLLLQGPLPAPTSLVRVAAVYEPPRGATPAAVAVTFTPLDPEVRVNEQPPPRLKLDPAQKVLADRQPPAKAGGTYDPENARYLDPRVPVRFAVAPEKDAPRGTHDVGATVVYFYCSKREGWCRRGSTPVAFPVRVD